MSCELLSGGNRPTRSRVSKQTGSLSLPKVGSGRVPLMVRQISAYSAIASSLAARVTEFEPCRHCSTVATPRARRCAPAVTG